MKLIFFSEWPDSPVILKYPPATSILNENPALETEVHFSGLVDFPFQFFWRSINGRRNPLTHLTSYLSPNKTVNK